MADKTLNQFTLATARPGLQSLVFLRDPDLSSPQSRSFTLQYLLETIQDGLTVKSAAVSDPTSLTPSAGDTYIVNPTGAGGWAGQNNKLAFYDGSSWLFSTPSEGWRVYDQNTNSAYKYSGSAWTLHQGTEVGYDNGTSGLTATNSQAAIDELASEKADLAGATFTAAPVVPTYTVAGVPSASTYARGIIYVSDESGGATIAFSDGTNWRRVSDRAVVS